MLYALLFLIQVKSKMRVQLETEVGNDDGFGFTIKGGKDKCLPITIETIVNGKLLVKQQVWIGLDLWFLREHIDLSALMILWS